MRVAPLKVFMLLLTVMTTGLCSCSQWTDDWRPSVDLPKLEPPLEQTAEPDAGTGTPDSDRPDEPLELTIEQAVLMAMENNRELHVERLEPEISRTFIEQELAAFDPVFSADVFAGRERIENSSANSIRSSQTGAELGLSRDLPTGTSVGVEASTERNWGTSGDDRHATRVGLSVTQALLEGRSVAANLADVRQARVDAALSAYEFRGFAEALVEEVENTYWRLVLAVRREEIVTESLRLAEQQLEDTNHRIRVGQLAETELAAAEAEVALRKEALINARSEISSLRVRLLRLINPQMLRTEKSEVRTVTAPTVPPTPVEKLDRHIQVALAMRPELKEAQLQLQRGELEVVKTRNGLLPKMDLFISLGKTGYADSFGQSVSDLPDDGYDMFVGLSLSDAPQRRAEQARHRRAAMTVTQRQRALENLRDLVTHDVELAVIEVNRTLQQVHATAATRQAQEEKVRAETAKFRVGNSTAFLVAAAQRDLLQSRVAEVEAQINYLTARIELYRAEGSLLARRGLSGDVTETR
ncbi:MAG: TolC family protein [Phycisphaerae bacterium]